MANSTLKKPTELDNTSNRIAFPDLVGHEFVVHRMVKMPNKSPIANGQEHMILLEITTPADIPCTYGDDEEDGVTNTSDSYTTIVRGRDPYLTFLYWMEDNKVTLPIACTLTTSKIGNGIRYSITGRTIFE